MIERMRPIQERDRSPAGEIVLTNMAGSGSSHREFQSATRLVGMHIPMAPLVLARSCQPSPAWRTRSRTSCVTVGLQFTGLFKGRGLDAFQKARLRDGNLRRRLPSMLHFSDGDWSSAGW